MFLRSSLLKALLLAVGIVASVVGLAVPRQQTRETAKVQAKSMTEHPLKSKPQRGTGGEASTVATEPQIRPDDNFARTVLRGFFQDLSKRPAMLESLQRHKNYGASILRPDSVVETLSFVEDPQKDLQTSDKLSSAAPALELLPVDLPTPRNPLVRPQIQKAESNGVSQTSERLQDNQEQRNDQRQQEYHLQQHIVPILTDDVQGKNGDPKPTSMNQKMLNGAPSATEPKSISSSYHDEPLTVISGKSDSSKNHTNNSDNKNSSPTTIISNDKGSSGEFPNYYYYYVYYDDPDYLSETEKVKLPPAKQPLTLTLVSSPDKPQTQEVSKNHHMAGNMQTSNAKTAGLVEKAGSSFDDVAKDVALLGKVKSATTMESSGSKVKLDSGIDSNEADLSRLHQ